MLHQPPYTPHPLIPLFSFVLPLSSFPIVVQKTATCCPSTSQNSWDLIHFACKGRSVYPFQRIRPMSLIPCDIVSIVPVFSADRLEERDVNVWLAHHILPSISNMARRVPGTVGYLRLPPNAPRQKSHALSGTTRIPRRFRILDEMKLSGRVLPRTAAYQRAILLMRSGTPSDPRV